MILAEIIWGASRWMAPAGVITALAVTVLMWGYWGAAASRRVRLAAALLKTIALLAIAVCLIEPLMRGERARPGANLFVLLADNSQSMQVRDGDQAASRGEIMRQQLAGESDWQTRLGQDFDVRKYAFDSRLRPMGDFAGLTLDGRGSALASSLDTLATRFQGRPLAGVLLFTDGNVAAADRPQIDWSMLPPIYPVLVGDAAPPKDIGLRRVTVSQTNFEEAPVTIQAEFVAHGYGGANVAAQLLDEQGKVLQEQLVKAPRSERAMLARFQLRPDRAGIRFYQVRVSAKNELEQFDRPEQSKEAALGNNRRLVAVDRAGGPYRVLYVSGRPNWEFKFLRRAVEADAEVELVGLVRIAKREPKFDYRSRVGETTNPLFRGFDNQEDETAEQYDQPVLLRVGTLDETELRDGFPKAADELFRYHAVILDDVEAEYFSPDQQALLRRFVGQRGGGLLMLGGLHSFAHGQYQRSGLGDLLPVYMDENKQEPNTRSYRWTLTREGWLQPWARLQSEQAAEEEHRQAMPDFQTFHRLTRIKPGASVLAAAENPRGETSPALVVQRFGKGRSAAIMVGDLWRWAMQRELSDDRDLEKSWRQTVRWLVADVPQRVECDVQIPDEGADAAVQIEVRVSDPEYQPLDNAQVAVEITQPDGSQVSLPADSSSQQGGVYETSFVPRQSGSYRALVSVAGPDGSEIAQREAGWTSQPEADEFLTLEPNRQLLEQLARETGGEMAPAGALDRFVTSLPNRRAPITEPWVYPLWHQAWWFLLALGCLIAEVGLRRWKGLP